MPVIIVVLYQICELSPCISNIYLSYASMIIYNKITKFFMNLNNTDMHF